MKKLFIATLSLNAFLVTNAFALGKANCGDSEWVHTYGGDSPTQDGTYSANRTLKNKLSPNGEVQAIIEFQPLSVDLGAGPLLDLPGLGSTRAYVRLSSSGQVLAQKSIDTAHYMAGRKYARFDFDASGDVIAYGEGLNASPALSFLRLDGVSAAEKAKFDRPYTLTSLNKISVLNSYKAVILPDQNVLFAITLTGAETDLGCGKFGSRDRISALVKFDPQGKCISQKLFDARAKMSVRDLMLAADGSPAIAGDYSSSLNLDGKILSVGRKETGSFVAKLDSNLKVIWAKGAGNTSRMSLEDLQNNRLLVHTTLGSGSFTVKSLAVLNLQDGSEVLKKEFPSERNTIRQAKLKNSGSSIEAVIQTEELYQDRWVYPLAIHDIAADGRMLLQREIRIQDIILSGGTSVESLDVRDGKAVLGGYGFAHNGNESIVLSCGASSSLVVRSKTVNTNLAGAFIIKL